MKNKFLLFAMGFLALCVPKSGIGQVLLNEDFEGATFPPSGWSNSTYTGTNVTSGFGPVYQWFAEPSGQTQPFYYNPAAPTAWAYYLAPSTGVNAHSGAIMAWSNTGAYYGGNSGQLATPAINYSTAGTNVLTFWYYYVHYSSPVNGIALNLYYSSTQAGPGTNFGTIYPVGTVNTTGWKQYTVNLPAGFASGDYIIFKSTNTQGYNYGDIHIDDVNVTHLTPCTGPVPGSIVNGLTCPGMNFNMFFSDSAHTGLTYLWQQSPDNVSWYNINNTSVTTTSIGSPTYFRVITTCTSGTNTYNDTAMSLVNPAPFYLCYCNDSGAGTYLANIGNVTIKQVPTGVTLMNNGSASPIINNTAATRNYTNYTGVAPATLYRDSAYSLAVTQIENSSAWNASVVRILIDLNRDGVFDPVTELVMSMTTQSATNPIVIDTLHVPHSAEPGLTGMRVILDPAGTYTGPCSPVSAGEVEDYLVNLSYPPCNAPANGGVALTSDTLMCPGDLSGHYSFSLMDTSYEHQFINLSRNWQISTDTGTTWLNVPGSTNQDNINLQYLAPSWYRVRMICLTNHDTTYSVVSKVSNDSSYRCYCYSSAVGGAAYDSTDIGAFSIGSDTVYYYYTPNNPQNNSHLNNVNATNGRITFTHDGIIPLFADSTYQLMAYDVMRTATDADAKVTMFIDYNNNLTYDPGTEMVWTATANSTNFFLTSSVHIPANVVTGVPTGMRIIINNNTAANIPSDDACGPYTSGETQDFVVKFWAKGTSVAGLSQNIQNLNLYPNPTNGKFNAAFSTNSDVKNLQINITNVTGQQVMSRSFQHVNGSFSTELDLSSVARGMYFVEFIADGERMVKKLTVN